MKTDTISYHLFPKFLNIFFALIGQPELPADTYQFTSIELQQLAFRLNGLYLHFYFIQFVLMQKDIYKQYLQAKLEECQK